MLESSRRKSAQEEAQDALKEDNDLTQSNDDESTSESSKEEVLQEDQVEISKEEIQHAIALASAAASNKFGWNSNNKSSSKGNPLSEIIHGYVAPMSLDSSSLDKYRSKKRIIAEATESEKDDVVISRNPPESFKQTKLNPVDNAKSKTNAGSGWFNFEATPYTDEIKADIAVIRNRTYLNPKKFYKSSDFGKKGSTSKMVQLGTVIEGSMESVYSNRLSKKQRKSTFVEEVMGETFSNRDDYVKKKFGNMQREKTAQRNRRVQFGKGAFRRKGR